MPRRNHACMHASTPTAHGGVLLNAMPRPCIPAKHPVAGMSVHWRPPFPAITQDLDSSGGGVVLARDPRYMGYPVRMLPDVENPAPRQASLRAAAQAAAPSPMHPGAENTPPRW